MGIISFKSSNTRISIDPKSIGLCYKNYFIHLRLNFMWGKNDDVSLFFPCGELAAQEASPQENGDVSPEAEFVPRKCDIITISGRTEKCELAKAALLVGTIFI